MRGIEGRRSDNVAGGPTSDNGLGAIAFFLPHLGFGGVERVTLDLAAGFAGTGRPVHLVVGRARGELRSGVPADVELVDLGARRVAAAVPRLAAYLRTRRPSALISAKTYANVAAILANLLSGTGTFHVACEHSFYQMKGSLPLRDRAALWLARFLYRRCDELVAVSRDAARATARLVGVDPDWISVIPNPVVTPPMRARARDSVHDAWLAGDVPVVVAVGRLVPEKGFDVLIEALAIARRTEDLRLLLLGEGEQRAALEGLARQLDLAEHVRLPGYVANPLPYMREADLFVLSSRFEAFPVVLVEALYCGASVVATRCAEAVEEVLEGGGLGRVVPVADPGALAEAMTAALGRPQDQALAQSRAESYSLGRAVEAYGELLAPKLVGRPS